MNDDPVGLANATESVRVPDLYFNGLELTVTPADVLMRIKRGDVPIGNLYMSHNIAKTVASLLGQLLATYESNLGITLETTLEINSRMEKAGLVNEQHTPDESD